MFKFLKRAYQALASLSRLIFCSLLALCALAKLKSSPLSKTTCSTFNQPKKAWKYLKRRPHRFLCFFFFLIPYSMLWDHWYWSPKIPCKIGSISALSERTPVNMKHPKLFISQKRLGPSFIDTWKYLLASQKVSPVALDSPWLSRHHIANSMLLHPHYPPFWTHWQRHDE